MKDGVISIIVDPREKDGGVSRAYEIPLKSGCNITESFMLQIHNRVARLLFDEYEISTSGSAMEIRGFQVKAYSEEEIQTMIVDRVREIALKSGLGD